MSVGASPEHAPTRGTHLPGEIGIWIFVCGDLLVFTLFFVLIALGNRDQPALFALSRAHLDMRLGLLNTVLLLTASWLVAAGVGDARSDHDARAKAKFAMAIGCAFGFIADKATEWSALLGAGRSPATNDFFMYYFVFCGIHLFHVVLGILFLGAMIRACARGVRDGGRDRLIESGGVFWHLVDLLWIVLFALLYLI